MKLDGVHRKRTTVMSADVVGYAGLMATDAASTLGALLAHFRMIEGLVRQFGGRIVDAPGDNVLVEFPDQLQALRCAVEVQRRLGDAPRNVGAPLRLHFRIGLHSGEALERRGRLYGDAVNIAARLQAAAEPGGILMSEAVAERALPSAHCGLVTLGPLWLKNVPYAVTTYRPLT